MSIQQSSVIFFLYFDVNMRQKCNLYKFLINNFDLYSYYLETLGTYSKIISQIYGKVNAARNFVCDINGPIMYVRLCLNIRSHFYSQSELTVAQLVQ